MDRLGLDNLIAAIRFLALGLYVNTVGIWTEH